MTFPTVLAAFVKSVNPNKREDVAMVELRTFFALSNHVSFVDLPGE